MPIINKTSEMGGTGWPSLHLALDRAIKRKFPFDYRREAKGSQAAEKGKAAHEALEKKLKP